jgi:hypothetical protein
MITLADLTQTELTDVLATPAIHRSREVTRELKQLLDDVNAVIEATPDHLLTEMN